MVEKPISLSLRFGHGPILVKINLQHSQTQPYGILYTRVICLTQTHLYVEHHTEKQFVPFFEVFGMTRPRLDCSPRPPEL